jgi:hypothetical protein
MWCACTVHTMHDVLMQDEWIYNYGSWSGALSYLCGALL